MIYSIANTAYVYVSREHLQVTTHGSDIPLHSTAPKLAAAAARRTVSGEQRAAQKQSNLNKYLLRLLWLPPQLPPAKAASLDE